MGGGLRAPPVGGRASSGAEACRLGGSPTRFLEIPSADDSRRDGRACGHAQLPRCRASGTVGQTVRRTRLALGQRLAPRLRCGLRRRSAGAARRGDEARACASGRPLAVVQRGSRPRGEEPEAQAQASHEPDRRCRRRQFDGARRQGAVRAGRGGRSGARRQRGCGGPCRPCPRSSARRCCSHTMPD